MTRMITECPAVRPTGSEQKTSRLQAAAGEDVTASLNRDSLARESAAIQVLDARATRAGNDLSTGKAGYDTNARERLSASPYSRAKSVDSDHRSNVALLPAPCRSPGTTEGGRCGICVVSNAARPH